MTDPIFPILSLDFEFKANQDFAVNPHLGQVLRGAWYGYLMRSYCDTGNAGDIAHVQDCPVCYLLAAEQSDSTRPYTFVFTFGQDTLISKDGHLNFGVNLYGNQAIRFAPYVITGLTNALQSEGIGSTGRKGERATLNPVAVRSTSPDGRVALLWGANVNSALDQPIIYSYALAQELARDMVGHDPIQIEINFLTPLHVIANQKLYRVFDFQVFYHRLLERIYRVAKDFGDIDTEERESIFANVRSRVEMARHASVRLNATRWVEASGHSRRINFIHLMGGLIGKVILDLPGGQLGEDILAHLILGQSVLVGKNAPKGSGRYTVKVK